MVGGAGLETIERLVDIDIGVTQDVVVIAVDIRPVGADLRANTSPVAGDHAVVQIHDTAAVIVSPGIDAAAATILTLVVGDRDVGQRRRAVVDEETAALVLRPIAADRAVGQHGRGLVDRHPTAGSGVVAADGAVGYGQLRALIGDVDTAAAAPGRVAADRAPINARDPVVGEDAATLSTGRVVPDGALVQRQGGVGAASRVVVDAAALVARLVAADHAVVERYVVQIVDAAAVAVGLVAGEGGAVERQRAIVEDRPAVAEVLVEGCAVIERVGVAAAQGHVAERQVPEIAHGEQAKLDRIGRVAADGMAVALDHDRRNDLGQPDAAGVVDKPAGGHSDVNVQADHVRPGRALLAATRGLVGLGSGNGHGQGAGCAVDGDDGGMGGRGQRPGRQRE